MEEPAATSESSKAPSTIERSPLEFSNENPSEQINEGDGAEDQRPETMAFVVPPAGPLLTTGVAPNIVEEEGTAADAPLVSKRRRKRANEESNVNAPRKETPAGTMNPDPISFAKPSSVPEQDIAQSSKGATAAGGPESDPSSPTIVMSPRGIYQPEWGVTNGCRLDTPSSCQELVDHLAPPEYFSELHYLPSKEFLGQFNMTLAQQVAMGSQLRLRFEQEAKLLRKSVAQAVEAKNAELVTGEEKIKAAFEEFKKYEDEHVSAQCAEMDSRLDAISIDFNEELYPHMLTAIAGRRWAKLDLAMVEGYDLEAEGKFIATMQALKDLKYPLIDELEKLRDAPMDVLMVSLYLESDTGADAPQWIRDLRPSSSQLKIPVYLEVRDQQDPWAVKEEMLLEDAIAANVSHAEKKKKCRIVCHTHCVGSAHHARSDDVPVSVPTAVS
ncbi:hypothetical protein Tco_1294274 [Tanacetum coccineum]